MCFKKKYNSNILLRQNGSQGMAQPCTSSNLFCCTHHSSSLNSWAFHSTNSAQIGFKSQSVQITQSRFSNPFQIGDSASFLASNSFRFSTTLHTVQSFSQHPIYASMVSMQLSRGSSLATAIPCLHILYSWGVSSKISGAP